MPCKYLVLLWDDRLFLLGGSSIVFLFLQGGHGIIGGKVKEGSWCIWLGVKDSRIYSEGRGKHTLIQWCKFMEGFGSLEAKLAVRSGLSSWDYDEFLSSYWLLSPKYICCFMQLRLPMKCIHRLNDSYNYRLKRTLHIHEYHTICHSCRPPVSNACD